MAEILHRLRPTYPLTVSSYSTGLVHAAREHTFEGNPERVVIISACGLLRGPRRRFTNSQRPVECTLCLRKLEQTHG